MVFAPGLQRAETTAEMVERLSMPIPECGCYAWLGLHNEKGYARSPHPRNGTKRVARLVYELANGKIPEGLEVDHVCRTRWCVNPNHLEVVTHQENIARAWETFVPKEFCEKHSDVRMKREGKFWVCRACKREYLRQWRAKQKE